VRGAYFRVIQKMELSFEYGTQDLPVIVYKYHLVSYNHWGSGYFYPGKIVVKQRVCNDVLLLFLNAHILMRHIENLKRPHNHQV